MHQNLWFSQHLMHMAWLQAGAANKGAGTSYHAAYGEVAATANRWETKVRLDLFRLYVI